MPSLLTVEELNLRLPKGCQILERYRGRNYVHSFSCPLCGQPFKTKAEHILSGHTKSCGCISYTKRTGVGELSGAFYSKIKTQAKFRKIEFKVSKEYLYDLLVSQNFKCALSGLEIHIGYWRGNERSKVTASLDRIDSTKPYIEGNVQWLHKHINVMKRSLRDDEFIWYCKKVVEYYG